MPEPIEVLKARLNMETAKIGWSELQRPFAKGTVFVVAPELDLVETAARMIHDDKSSVEKWIEQNKLVQANIEDARRWNDTDPDLWAVVVAPWILVQEATG